LSDHDPEDTAMASHHFAFMISHLRHEELLREAEHAPRSGRREPRRPRRGRHRNR
jgi:hypothetical protein